MDAVAGGAVFEVVDAEDGAGGGGAEVEVDVADVAALDGAAVGHVAGGDRAAGAAFVGGGEQEHGLLPCFGVAAGGDEPVEVDEGADAEGEGGAGAFVDDVLGVADGGADRLDLLGE